MEKTRTNLPLIIFVALPVVAASIGPYGAYLADGSEYRGDYDITEDQLYEFHLSRWRVLAASEADLLACETIPSGREAAVLLGIPTGTVKSRLNRARQLVQEALT